MTSYEIDNHFDFKHTISLLYWSRGLQTTPAGELAKHSPEKHLIRSAKTFCQ